MLADLRDEMRRYCLRIMLAVLAALVAMIGLVMLMVAAHLGLTESMPPPAAAAVTGGIVLGLAGLIALASQRLGSGASRKPIRESATDPSIKDRALGIGELLGTIEAAIGADARSATPHFAFMALLAGCAVGASPRLRRAIADLAR